MCSWWIFIFCGDFVEVLLKISVLSIVGMNFVILNRKMAVPYLRRLVAGFPPQRPGFAPGSVRVGFVVEWHWDSFFFQSPSVFLCQYYSTAVPHSFMYHFGDGQWAF
jgi:hypothetical protein